MARFSNGSALTATPKPTGSGLAVELGRGREVDAPVDPGDAVGAVLVGAEVAGESGERDGDSRTAPAFHRRSGRGSAVADLERRPGDGDALPSVGPRTSRVATWVSLTETVRSVTVLGRLRPGRSTRPGRPGPGPWPWGLASHRRRGAPASQSIGLVELGGIGLDAGVGQSDQRGDLGRPSG